MTLDRPVLGIFLMIGFCFIAPLGDGLSKLLGTRIPIAEIVFFRLAFQALILLPLAVALKKPLVFKGRHLRILAIRAFLYVIGVFAMLLSLSYLPLADALAIAFVMPFIMLFLGWAYLGESIGPHRIFAATVGFVGTLLVIQPSFAAVGWPATLPLIVAVVFALFMMVTRMVASEIDPIGLQSVTGLLAFLMVLPLIAVGAWLDIEPLGLIRPSAPDLILLCFVGTLSTIGHLLMTLSLRYAPSATLAPMQYLEIPFAAAIGWFLFQDFPNGLAAVGICITVGAGLYVILREQAIARHSA